ncbi:phosphatase PAP2 family protein [Salinivibrio sp. HTSP]|uniref:phosphatase PAP2 family protein n=1 Tax=Salinivibrio sp. HTSP TaxID=2115977 RepID=UPI000E312542|nr:phosphatase PAP2 family protein [Salinivibrio sp. HTSP]
MKRIIAVLLSVFSGLVSSDALADNETTFSNEQGIAGVACIISDPAGRLLLVKDTVTGRYGLPGGRVNLAESPSRALAREVFEETAIRVTVGDVYHQDARCVLFACQSQAPLPVVSTAEGVGLLPAWRAPHFASEIEQARLVPRAHAQDYRYRFNDRRDHLWSLAAKTPSSDVSALADFSALAPVFYVSQYGLVSGVQNTVQKLGDAGNATVTAVFKLVNTLGEIAFYIALVPLFLVFRGHKSALSLLFLLISAAAVSTTLKSGFAMPRPFYLWPDLQIGQASGFTVPSGHTLLAAAVMTAWYLKRRVTHPPAFGALAMTLVVIVLMGLNRMYLGVHFASDVVIGALVGSSVAWATIKLDAVTVGNERPVLTTGRIWFLACLIMALLALALKIPNMVYLSALAAGVYTGQVWHKLFPSHKPASRLNGKLLTLAWIFFGIAAIVGAAWGVAQLTGLSWIVLIVVSMAAWSLGPWVLIASPELAKWSGKRLGWREW